MPLMSEPTAKGKTIWIIGASTGIGYALAQRLHDEGACLALSARSSDKLDQLLHQLSGHVETPHMSVPADIRDAASLAKSAAMIHKRYGHLDSVIVLAAQYEPMPLDALDLTKTAAILDVNLMGAFNTINACLPIFKEQGKGQIVLCASVAGYCGLPNAQPYSATKAAIINLAQSLRAELGPKGWCRRSKANKNRAEIDIKLINPGFVSTPMTDKNSFDMPMIITPEKAAIAIAKGLHGSHFEIIFPRRFVYLMKVLQSLPYWLYFKITAKMAAKA